MGSRAWVMGDAQNVRDLWRIGTPGPRRLRRRRAASDGVRGAVNGAHTSNAE